MPEEENFEIRIPFSPNIGPNTVVSPEVMEEAVQRLMESMQTAVGMATATSIFHPCIEETTTKIQKTMQKDIKKITNPPKEPPVRSVIIQELYKI